MKALILAGGRGKRAGAASDSINKCMIKIDGKPLIERSLDCVSETKSLEIIIVVGYKAEDIINTYGNNYRGKRIRYVFQTEQKGLVHAIECAAGSIGREDFMLMLGDEFMVNPHHREMIRLFSKEALFGICGIVKVKNRQLIKKTYSVIQSKEGKIFRLIEKPNHPLNDIMGTGNCIFKNQILSYIDQTPINQKRKEKELPDLIQCAIDDGHSVKSFQICDDYINVNLPMEIEQAKSYFSHP